MHYFFIHDKLNKKLFNRSERVSKSKLLICYIEIANSFYFEIWFWHWYGYFVQSVLFYCRRLRPFNKLVGTASCEFQPCQFIESYESQSVFLKEIEKKILQMIVYLYLYILLCMVPQFYTWSIFTSTIDYRQVVLI